MAGEVNLVAIDGTTIRVTDETEIVQHFGFCNVNKGDRCPKARASQLFDVLNKITLDAIISPKSEGERELATYHFLKLMPSDLEGRGRPHSREQRKMIIDLIDKAVESCARLKKAAATMGLSAHTIIRWRHQGGGQDQWYCGIPFQKKL